MPRAPEGSLWVGWKAKAGEREWWWMWRIRIGVEGEVALWVRAADRRAVMLDSKAGVLRGGKWAALWKPCWMSMRRRAVGVVDAGFMVVVYGVLLFG